MTRGVQRGSAGDHRSRTERVLGDRPQLDSGLVGGEGHVDDDRQVGIEGKRARPRAGEVVSSWATASARTSPGAPRPRPPAARPRRPRSSRCGCPARGRRAGRWASRPASASITPTSPIRTSSRASSPSLAPMSICRSLISGDLLALLALDQVDRLAADHAGDRCRPAWRSAPADRPARSGPSRPPRQSAGSPRRRYARRGRRSRRCGRSRPASGRRRCPGPGPWTSRRGRREPRGRTPSSPRARRGPARPRGRTGRRRSTGVQQLGEWHRQRSLVMRSGRPPLARSWRRTNWRMPPWWK